MSSAIKVFSVITMALSIQFAGTADGGILKSLDDELTALVEKTGPYLVTVKGESDWRSLISTGIVFDKAGYVITSSYAYDVGKHNVTFNDGVSYPTEKIGVDHQTGLAVLKILGDGFQKPSWGKSEKLKSGAWIIVLGNSYGTPATVNFGVYEGRSDENYLKLAVGVSPGGSGGAVLNTDGEIVGVLIAREAENGLSSVNDYRKGLYLAKQNLRFLNLMGDSKSKAIAVPIEQALDVARELVEHGKIRRGFLGISQRNLTSDERERYEVDSGIMVVEVVDDSPAEKAGLEKGDIITKVDKESIKGISDLYSLIRSRKPGDTVSIAVARDSELLKVEAVLDSADNKALFGGWELKDPLPVLNLGKSFQVFDNIDLEQNLRRLERELDRLGDELAKLRDNLKK